MSIQVTTRGRYAVRALFTLAVLQRESEQPVALKTIADEEGISLTYLEQLFRQLRKAGILRSSRGASGGYCLARPAADISMREVISAVEGPIEPARECETMTQSCAQLHACTIGWLWTGLGGLINCYLDKISLQELIDRSTKERVPNNQRV